MLDLKFVRENLELVKQNLDNRHTKGDIDTFVDAYDERKQLIQQVEELKALRNSVTEEISQLKRNKENADEKIAEYLVCDVRGQLSFTGWGKRGDFQPDPGNGADTTA